MNIRRRRCKEAPVASADPTNAVQHPPQESNLHEHSTIALSGLVKFVIWFTVSVVAIHLIILAVFFAFRAAAAQEREITGVNAPLIPPPPPRLQPSPAHNRLESEDLQSMQRADAAELKHRQLQDEQGNFYPELIERIAAESSPPTTK